MKTPPTGGFIVLEYDPLDQFDKRGVKTTQVLGINKNGTILLEFVDAPGVLVTNAPLTKDLKIK